MKEIPAIEKVVAQLAAEGWREQRSGMVYINGTWATNLLKDGELISLQQDFYPDGSLLRRNGGMMMMMNKQPDTTGGEGTW